MTHLDQALEFAGGVGGFFAAIIGLLIWLTHLEQTLDKSQPRPKPIRAKTPSAIAVTVRAWAKARRDSEPRQPTETAGRDSQGGQGGHQVSPEQFSPDRDR